jgi:hypothetical protein
MKLSSIRRTVIVVLALYTAHQIQADTLQTIQQALDKSSTEVFATKLYQKAFSDAAAMPWTQAVARAGDFISDMKNNMNNPDMASLYKEIKTANDTLISTIQSTYKDLFRSGTPADTKTVNATEAKFEKIKNAMTDAQDAINALNRGTKYVLSQQEEVRTLLSTLASKIKANASIAQTQIEEEMAQRTAEANASEKATQEKAKTKEEKKTAPVQPAQAPQTAATPVAPAAQTPIPSQTPVAPQPQQEGDIKVRKEASDLQRYISKLIQEVFVPNPYGQALDIKSLNTLNTTFETLIHFVDMHKGDSKELNDIMGMIGDAYHITMQTIKAIHPIFSKPASSAVLDRRISELKGGATLAQAATDLSKNPPFAASFNSEQQSTLILLHNVAVDLSIHLSHLLETTYNALNNYKKQVVAPALSKEEAFAAKLEARIQADNAAAALHKRAADQEELRLKTLAYERSAAQSSQPMAEEQEEALSPELEALLN